MQLDFKDTLTRLTCFALDFMEEIQTQNADVDPEECRAMCIELLRAFDQPGSKAQTFQSAKYALTAWIDDRLTRSRWPHAAMWNSRSLEQELYGSNCRNWKFFEQAELAGQREDWEALRVYQFCVAFGFLGIYGKDRMRVRLTDPLPMSRAPLASPGPMLIGVLKEEASGVSRSEAAFVGGFWNDSSDTLTAKADSDPTQSRKRSELVLPPTLDEWSERAFAALPGSSTNGLGRWFRFNRVFPATDLFKEWAIVMAVGLLLTAVLFAIGH